MNRETSILNIETLEERQMLSAVELFASGETGEEIFQLFVNDVVVIEVQVTTETQAFRYESTDDLSATDVKVRFVNDAFDPATNLDRNLIVDKVVIDGVTYHSEHPSTFSTGSYTADGLSPGNWQTEYLHTNGEFAYSPDAAQSTIEIVASGSTGDESFLLDINGQVVGEFDVSTSDQTFRTFFNGIVDPAVDIVRVEFTNDLFIAGEVDRDLLVDKIIVNGINYESEAETTYSTGTWLGEGVPHEGFVTSNTLHVTGYFEYLAATDVTVRASGDEGGETILVQVEEETVVSFVLTTNFDSYLYRHFTKLTPDQIRVAFVGDQYDPANGIDANANIDWIEIAGTRIESEAPTVFSNATYTTEGLAPGFGRGSTLQTDGFFQYAFAVKDDQFSLPEDSISVPLAVFANDNIASPIDIEIASDAGNGTLDLIDGELFYTPNAEFVGTDQFAYRRLGTSDDVAVVDINVRQSHQNPQSLINPAIASELTPSGKTLVVQKLVKIPLGDNNRQPRLNGLATIDGRTFVLADGTVDGEGRIYELVTDTAGVTTAELFLDVGAATLGTAGIEISNFAPLYGLRGFAFHPEFATNGKFYVSFTAARPDNPENFVYLSSPENPVAIESVVAEWTYDQLTGEVDETSYRELFRVGMQTLDHPIAGMAFDPFAVPGDENYGLLFIGHGDGSEQSAIAGDGQDNNALGKVLRIDPLVAANAAFSVPDSNPFVGVEDFPDAVYAVGFRNPHNLSFAEDADGVSHLIVAEIGRDNIEEVNVVVKGGNYGWADREGIFVHVREQFRLNGNIANLPDNEAENGFIFPVSFFGHDGEPGSSFVGQAIAGGHVIQNGSGELDDQYIFVEFATDGRAYHIDFSDALQQTTTLDPNDPDRDSPEDLTWLTPQELTILFDHDNDPDTTPLIRDSLKDVLDDEPDFEAIPSAGKIRADLRLGEGPDGLLYILNKRNGWIYVATNTLPPEADLV